MFHLEDVLQLKEGEHVLAIMRRHGSTLVPPLLLAFILIVVPFFMLFPLFSMGIVGMIIFGAAIVLGLGVAIRAFVLWDADVFILTDARVVDVDQKGIFNRFVAEASIGAIQDVSWTRRGMVQTLFGIGTLSVRTAGGGAVIEAKQIKRPEHLQDVLNDLRNGPPKRGADGAMLSPPKDANAERAALLKTLQTMLSAYPLEELDRILIVLRAREKSAAADAFYSGDAAPKA